MKGSEVIAGVGLADRPRKSRWPARMDLAQSASGDTDVLVIGGGLAGLRLAIGAKRRGHDAIILSLVPTRASGCAT